MIILFMLFDETVYGTNANTIIFLGWVLKAEKVTIFDFKWNENEANLDFMERFKPLEWKINSNFKNSK